MRCAIPRILHQTWKTHDLPDYFQKYSDEWSRMHPEFEHRIYNDQDLREVVEKHFPQYLTLYDNFPKQIFRVDFARYAILYVYGGIYADLDTRPLKRVDKLLALERIVLGEEPREHSRRIYGRNMVICNAFMISPPQQPFWLRLMEFIQTSTAVDGPSDVVSVTGPMAITRMYDKHPDHFRLGCGVDIKNSCYLFPLIDASRGDLQGSSQGEYTNVSKYCNLDDAYIVHIWTHEYLKGTFRALYLVLFFIFLIIVAVVVAVMLMRSARVKGSSS